jgi:hypothetical protein
MNPNKISMKKLIMLTAFFLVALPSFSQYQLEKGKMQINTGIGLSSWGVPVYVGLDYGLAKDISLGGEITFRSYREKISKIEYQSRIIGILANGNYHFKNIWHLPDSWDLYAGLNIGFYIWNTESNYPGTNTTPANAGAQFGGRYYVSETFSLNFEAGTGNAFSGGKVGVSFMLK